MPVSIHVTNKKTAHDQDMVATDSLLLYLSVT